MIRSAEQVALLGALAWRFPVLQQFLQTHQEENDGELLPHLLIADYERWAEQALQDDDPQLQEFLDALEDAYRDGGEMVQQLIAVSFLEHLPRPGEPGSELRERVGPTMAEQLRVIG